MDKNIILSNPVFRSSSYEGAMALRRESEINNLREQNLLLDLDSKFGIVARLKNIWNTYPALSGFLPPLYQKEMLNEVITFLSLNPSLNPNDKKSIELGNESQLDCSYPYIYFKDSAKLHHFKKFCQIGNELDERWTAMDLLYFRNSNQKEVKRVGDSEFVIEQMRLTFEILSAMKPKVVVVSNATVDELIHKHSLVLNLKIEMPEQGNNYTYFINGLPFIIKESRYISNRRLWYSSEEKRTKLVGEIKRIIQKR